MIAGGLVYAVVPCSAADRDRRDRTRTAHSARPSVTRSSSDSNCSSPATSCGRWRPRRVHLGRRARDHRGHPDLPEVHARGREPAGAWRRRRS